MKIIFIMKNKKLISILIVFLFILLCDGNVLTFYDEHLAPQQIISYSDSSVVFRLVERLNDTCNVPNLSFRILYPNGTESKLITVYDYEHQIPSLNFCQMGKTENQIIPDQLILMNTITNYILVTYLTITEENTILIFGMMIDWNGKITR